ncbi:MAG: hypothetical protein JW776_11060 [Candidatus Lokiarchaeota archaeon]|nr:hypothetical protein [Candidatus Lokiarchaeota archaeon]
MEKRKLIAGIVLLVIGIGLIPGTIGMGNLINYRMDQTINPAFDNIRSEFSTEAESFALKESIPQMMQELKDTIIPNIPILINGSVSAKVISNVLNNLTGYIGQENATEWFFNDPTFTINTDGNYSIQGISEYSGLGNLSFSTLAINRILSAILTNYAVTNGIKSFLENYEDSVTDLDDRNEMMQLYNATWEQLENVSTYLTDYLFPLVPTLGSLPFEATSLTAEDFFYIHWANGTVLPNGIRIFFSQTVSVVNWELKQPDLNLNLSMVKTIWNTTNEYSPFNEQGILKWIWTVYDPTEFTEIEDGLGINNTLVSALMDHLFNTNFLDNVINRIFNIVSTQTLAEKRNEGIIRQWADGIMVPTGLGSIDSLYAGFEVTLPPNDLGIDLSVLKDIWFVNNTNALRNSTDGLDKWFTIARAPESERSDLVEYQIITAEFGLDSTQMNLISDWLKIFRNTSTYIIQDIQGFQLHPYEILRQITIGGYIGAGIIGFVGIFLIGSQFKKQR